MTKRESALCALVHLDAAADHLQALHALDLPEPIKRTVILAKKVNYGIAEDVKKAGRIPAESAIVYLPAFPTWAQKHIKPMVGKR